MYQVRHRKKSASRLRKSFVNMVSVLILVLGLVGGSIAYLATQTGDLKNEFEYAQVSSQVDESFDGSTKSNVTIKNTSDISAYIRARVVITWKDLSGNVYGKQPIEGVDYNISYGSEWTLSEGYFYYDSPIDVGNSTPVLINSSTEIAANRPDGFALSVEIIADAIQSEPAKAITEAWGYTPSGN